MFGMIKNSLFGNTEETEYKLLSSETKVSSVLTPVTHNSITAMLFKDFAYSVPCASLHGLITHGTVKDARFLLLFA